MTSLVIRPLVQHEARQLFTSLDDSLDDPGLVGRALLGRSYESLADSGEYRPEWTWAALREGKVVARAAFWAAPRATEPHLLDWFDFAPGEHEAAAQLLREATPRLEYELILPPSWREDPAIRTAADARISAAEAAGFRLLVERFRYSWTPDCGLPAQPGRLDFRPEPDDAVILDVLRRIEQGSLDGHAQQAVAEGGVEQAAQEELDHFRWMSSPREWWRLAYTPEGEVVGLHVPGLVPSGPAAAFIGVVPEQRGHGYAYDLLADCTHHLAAEGAKTIAASTDLGNTPMAANFTKAGYPVIQHRYCMTPAASPAGAPAA
ncbi:GNAT family N-acetyltransferase [Streptomyces sp. N2-109]|uniref:GNAT family N-acetyltransferase n=1 Tax=Streptomyces gossypii TaxID=2883101 RepID=A0ABT2JTS5_9ACTN|nr:GNAT family N-acetyltransferase [Streptomyces gossypii]MCT2590884.1 GNAT family N-acetyltransferase [Streptomyces gossypii]